MPRGPRRKAYGMGGRNREDLTEKELGGMLEERGPEGKAAAEGSLGRKEKKKMLTYFQNARAPQGLHGNPGGEKREPTFLLSRGGRTVKGARLDTLTGVDN